MNIKLQNQKLIQNLKKKVKPVKNFHSNSNEDSVIGINRNFSAKERNRIVIEGHSSKMEIDKLCAREGISPEIFYLWTDEFLTKTDSSSTVEKNAFKSASDFRFEIVIEGKSGETSIAEICRRECISQDTFLKWSKEFHEIRINQLKVLRKKDPTYLKHSQLIEITTKSNKTFDYFENYVDFTDHNTHVFLRSDSLRLDNLSKVTNIISLQKANDVRFINKYFEKINSKMENEGIFIGCFETFKSRRNRMKINKIPVLGSCYFGLEFLFNRILPKVSFTKKYYFDFTKGNDRLLSKAEGLGRLVSCGFKIMDYKLLNGIIYFVVKKVSKPSFDASPSYGPVYKMQRLGKNGDKIGVYKFRTMHPYSEYLQDYMVRAHGYADTGKPANDFRIPFWGKFMRRFWLDELPQLYNVLKGELKLVGIRPVSSRYFEDIPTEMQKLRLTQKPGCIPPYVALNRDGNVMSVLQSEKDYITEKIKNPYSTDLKYFFGALFNIVVRHKRSA